MGVDGFRCDVINLIAKNNNHPNGKKRLILQGREHYINYPNLHKYLHELNQDVFSKYNCFTVGETVFVSTKDGIMLTSPKRKELDMIFQFEHMDADNYFVKWFIKKFKPMNLKKPLSRWQNDVNELGWNTLFLESHDQPRSINRFGSLEYHYESATMLATMLYFQQGTPFIYQGQEIGMTNISFDDLNDYQDVETHNMYKTLRKLCFSKKRTMKKIKYVSRDNARTPMQWDDSKNAGFSNNDPWLKVNPNYKNINVAKEQIDKDSILNYYKEIIKLRKQYPVIVYGKYSDIDFNNKSSFIYKRYTKIHEMIILCNFTDKDYCLDNPDYKEYKLILSNYKENDDYILKPYEARVYYK